MITDRSRVKVNTAWFTKRTAASMHVDGSDGKVVDIAELELRQSAGHWQWQCIHLTYLEIDTHVQSNQ